MKEQAAGEQQIHFFKRLDTAGTEDSQTRPLVSATQTQTGRASLNDIQSGETTCADAETFALRVLDATMEPEFRQGCLIIIDPTGHVRDGAYVLAMDSGAGGAGQIKPDSTSAEEAVQQFVFRQLRRVDDRWCLVTLNESFPETREIELTQIVGVIIQRAGVRRRYHKHYE